jgi:hypothetical protein
VRAAGVEPAQALRPYGFSYPLRLSPPDPARFRAGGFGVWTIPSPWPRGFRCCPSSLYTFPFPGLARDCHLTGSPEFGQFCIAGFPASTQVWLKSVASTSFATPAWGIAIALVLAFANRVAGGSRFHTSIVALVKFLSLLRILFRHVRGMGR